jgi:TonB family protein
VIDQKALEAEVKKQAGAEADRLRKEAAAVAAGAGKGLPPAAAPAGAAKPGSLAEAQKAPTTAIPPVAAAAPSAPAAPVAAPPAPTAAPARPTAEPVRVAEAAPKPAAEASIPAPPPVPAAAGPAKEGDLVGPGTGVVEPKIVKLGAYTLGPQAKQIATRRGESSLGTVVIMALVSEKGTITETRIVRKSNYPFVDEAALTALKGAAVEPATKDGVRVKMYKAFPITVKP